MHLARTRLVDYSLSRGLSLPVGEGGHDNDVNHQEDTYAACHWTYDVSHLGGHAVLAEVAELAIVTRRTPGQGIVDGSMTRRTI